MSSREQLERSIEAKRRELEAAEQALRNADAACRHEFGTAENADIYHPPYTIPGDTPGTMGVDYRGPCHVPSKTEKRWRRTCKKCGKVEFTTRIASEVKVVQQPQW
jgi:hypothetical protein